MGQYGGRRPVVMGQYGGRAICCHPKPRNATNKAIHTYIYIQEHEAPNVAIHVRR